MFLSSVYSVKELKIDKGPTSGCRGSVGIMNLHVSKGKEKEKMI
jgi:hypothetical protein